MQNKIYVGNNALNGFIKVLKNDYSLFKILIVVSENESKAFEREINNLLNITLRSKLFVLPNFVPNCELTKKLLLNELEEDVGLVICFGDSNLIKICSENISTDKAYILNSPSLISLLYSSKYTILDNNIIFNCSHKMFASCYGEVASMLIYILELVFNKGIYKKNVSTEKLIKQEQLLNSLIELPSAVLQSRLGKTMFIKILVELSKIIDIKEFELSVLNTLKNNLIIGSKVGGLLNGEALIIASKILLKQFNILFNLNALNELITFSPNERITYTKKYNKNISTTFIKENFNNFDFSKSQMTENYFYIKTNYLSVLNCYNQKFITFVKIFCNLQFDKGVNLKKYSNEINIINSVNKLPEQATEPNFSTFIRTFGFLNKMLQNN